MTTENGLDQEVSDYQGRHALLNAVVVGVYLRLIADGAKELAAAWLESAVSFEDSEMPLMQGGPYSRTARPVLRMTLRPMSSARADRIRSNLDEVRSAVREFSSDSSGELEREAVVWVDVADPVAPTTEARTADIRSALEECGEQAADILEDFDDLVDHSVLSWSSYASQRVQHLAIIDGTEDEVARGSQLLRSISENLWRQRIFLETGSLNNISFASRAPGPELIAQAAAADAMESSPAQWRVGIIVPGGNAARSDIEQVENHPDLQCELRIVPRKASDFPARMSAALGSMRSGNDALLIAYGGGSADDLAKVREALAPHLEAMDIPCWVAVGHKSDEMSISNDLVRVCGTPSDARALFLAETIDYEKKMAKILMSNARKLSEGQRKVRTRKRVVDELKSLDRVVLSAREQHLQAGSE